MSIWMIATLALLPPLAVPLWIAVRSDLANRFVAVQLTAAIASFTLVLMSFAFDQNSLIDLPLTLALLSLPGTLMLALFMERWL